VRHGEVLLYEVRLCYSAAESQRLCFDATGLRLRRVVVLSA
jgi:hypothetical protein